ncbi:MAG TPA: trypsin-like peptidase domain-containing protein [Solirubrobacterales bacterium]|jgi:S1-C subfamily serine protease|nr:trypsin-like peptidase domain-containing protein [Solirubrobacterales bacterium]
MPKKKRTHPFGSALLGGAVVAVFGLLAIATGLVSTGGGSTTTREVVSSGTTPAASVTSNGEGGNTVNQIYKADADGVAFIESKESEGVASGSGIVLDDEGHVLTNNHVIEGATEVTVSLESEGQMYPATVVGTEPNSDLALLKVQAPASQLHPLKLGNSSEMEVGDPVVAIGNPFDLQRTVTSGIVSALQREIQAPNGVTIDNVIQTDAAINPGNSGGPLINSAGEVIGINSQIETGGEGDDGNVGIGFSIPINTAKEEIAQLESGTADEHGYLGVSAATITPELAKAFNLPVEEGVLVQQVEEGGPAAEAGIQGASTAATVEGQEFGLGGDIITAVNGEAIASTEDLVEKIEDGHPGETVELSVIQEEKTATVSVKLAERPATSAG